MAGMPTQSLKLERREDGYYRTRWTDDLGKQREKRFGKFAASARNRFNRFYNKWRTDERIRNPEAPALPTLADDFAKFMKHAHRFYVRADGSATGEAANFEDAMRETLDLFGTSPAAEFTVANLKESRKLMAKNGLCVNVINARVRKVRQVFRWFVSDLGLNAMVWHALQALQPLEAGRPLEVGTDEFITPRVSEPVGPAPEAHVFAVADACPPTIAAMIMFQYWTGARPGETCRIRATELDVSGPVWLFSPSLHKTAHRKKIRTILVGPRAQLVIAPFMTRTIGGFIFRPCDAWDERQAQRVAKYAPKAAGDYRSWASYQARSEEKIGRGGECWNPKAYAKAIMRVCDDLNIPRWSPNQLRHNAATRIRKAYGLDVAQVVLGHSKADVTQIYADIDREKAVRAMEAAG